MNKENINKPFCNLFQFRSTLPESWAANSFKKLHEALGMQKSENFEHRNEGEGIENNYNVNSATANKKGKDNKMGTDSINTKIKSDQRNNENKNCDKSTLIVDPKPAITTNAFMQLTYPQKDICVGNFWEVFCQEAENQGITPASFATFLGARAAIPGPAAPQGAWGQFSSGNRSVLDTFRKLRFGKFLI